MYSSISSIFVYVVTLSIVCVCVFELCGACISLKMKLKAQSSSASLAVSIQYEWVWEKNRYLTSSDQMLAHWNKSIILTDWTIYRIGCLFANIYKRTKLSHRNGRNANETEIACKKEKKRCKVERTSEQVKMKLARNWVRTVHPQNRSVSLSFCLSAAILNCYVSLFLIV